MGKSYSMAIVEKCQGLYVADGYTMEEVSRQTKIPRGTLQRWSTKYGWRSKRDEVVHDDLQRRVDLIKLRSERVRYCLDSADAKAIDVFAVAKLEEAAIKAQEFALKVREAVTPESAAPDISTPEEAKTALYNVVIGKIATMLADPGQLNLKFLKDLRSALDYLQPAESKVKRKGISAETAQDIIDKVLGG